MVTCLDIFAQDSWQRCTLWQLWDCILQVHLRTVCCSNRDTMQWKQQKQDSKSFLHTSININWKLSKNIERRNITCWKLIIKTSKSFHFFSQAALRGPDNHCHMSWNYDITSGNTDIWQAQISTISWEAEDHKQDPYALHKASTNLSRHSSSTVNHLLHQRALLLHLSNPPFCNTLFQKPSLLPQSATLKKNTCQ